MRTHATPHLGFLVAPPSLPHCLTIVRFTGEDMLSQAVESPVEMVNHAGYRLIAQLANLGKGIALVEMQAEGLPLVLGQALDQFLPANPSEKALARTVVSGHRR